MTSSDEGGEYQMELHNVAVLAREKNPSGIIFDPGVEFVRNNMIIA